jgi:hypothetical protein
VSLPRLWKPCVPPPPLLVLQVAALSTLTAFRALLPRRLHEFAVLVRDLQLYSSFDTDCNGVIDADEICGAMRQLGLESHPAAQSEEAAKPLLEGECAATAASTGRMLGSATATAF